MASILYFLLQRSKKFHPTPKSFKKHYTGNKSFANPSLPLCKISRAIYIYAALQIWYVNFKPKRLFIKKRKKTTDKQKEEKKGGGKCKEKSKIKKENKSNQIEKTTKTKSIINPVNKYFDTYSHILSSLFFFA